ncbi:unnamed protein product (macronuclear) [Paramecium tetraurelia]|uniref:PAS domain-containing protein n=1 Tax=Paramecium tetraurelia TaxID=5888 RepID=A0BKG6_PARTE|nr:uncharacterized protein GSPATT00029664001 [Paramecium tetraurelia]CAK59033.1 unnamed protein product [Paramecium tetraurelia]|eukprot:XP_001426431.1 hypothetical protein (macronuclear) [Paramecium tetraurelia strain d4-2]
MRMMRKQVFTLLEGYISFTQSFHKQHKELLMLTIRILLIICGLQELQLISGLNTDTKKIFKIISQFIITNYLIIIDNQQMLIYLAVVHLLINIFCVVIVTFFKHYQNCQYMLVLLIKIQHQILILPTWNTIFYQINNYPSVKIYILTICNLIMYVQQLLWMSICKQTQLIDFTGIIYHQNLMVDIFYEIITVLAILLAEISTDASVVLFIIKYLSKILFLKSILNNNSTFYLIYQVIMINLIVCFEFNIQFIFVLPILTFSIYFTLNIQKRLYDSYLLDQNITLQKCQLIESLLYNKFQSQKALIQKALLISSQQSIKTRSMDQLIQLLLSNKKYKDSLIVKIQCNYSSQLYPLQSLIQFHSQYKSDSILSKAYLNVITKEINIQLKRIQDAQIKKAEIPRLTIAGFLLAQYKSVESLSFLESTLKQKLGLLEYLRLGFSSHSRQQDRIIPYVKAISECKILIQQEYDLEKNTIMGQQYSDILTLRILQLYFGIIMVNTKKAIEIEKIVDELLRYDKQFNEFTINNQILLTNRSMIIQTSLIHDQGQLLNYNKEQASQFFSCPLEAVGNYKYIYDFMPDYIASLHDELVNKFLEKGKSKLMQTGSLIFLKTPKNFIQPGYLHLYNPLKMDDITLYAIITQYSQYFEYIVFDQDGIIMGVTQKIFNFMGELISENNQKHYRLQDIVEKGGQILHYIQQIPQQLKQLQENIQSSQNYQLINVRSFWEFPNNNNDCIVQTQFLINQMKLVNQKAEQEELINEYTIDNIYVNLLDPNFQDKFFLILNNRTTYKFSEVKQRIEMAYTIQMTKIYNKIYFLLQIQDYRLTDAANTLISTSQNKSAAKTLSLTMSYQLEQQESDQISSEGHQIREIQVFNNLHQQLLVEKLLFDDPEIDYEGVLDKNSSKQMNFSQNQSKTPFILTQRQTHRQLLSGQQSFRGSMQKTEFVLPQLSVQEQVNKDYDILNQLERDMVEISRFKQDPIQEFANDNKGENDNADYISKSFQTSKDIDQNDHKQMSQKVSSLQIDLIREIVDASNNIRLLANAKTLTWILEILILIYIVINTILVQNQFSEFKEQIYELKSIQTLNKIIVSNYQLIQSTYLQGLKIYTLSPYLQESLNQSLSESYQAVITDQLDLERQSCIYLDKYANDSNFERCFIYFNRLQENQLSFLRNRILSNLSYDFEQIRQTPSYFQEQIFYLIYKFLIYSDEFVQQFEDIQLSNVFIVILITGLLMIITIFTFIFKVVSAKSSLKSKLVALLQRLTQEEIVEQIATLTIIIDSWKTQQWKQYNFYDLWSHKQNQFIKEISPTKNKRKSGSNSIEKSFKETFLIFIEALILIFFIVFFVGGYILLLNLFDSYIPSVTVNKQFLLFQQKVGSSITLGQIIKTEPLINNFRNKTEQFLIIQKYFEIIDQLPTVILDITESIVQYDFIDSSSINQIVDSFNSDYCQIYDLPFCIVRQFQNESYAQFLKEGVNGMIQNIYQFSISEFESEKLNGLFETDLELLKQTISQRLFVNIFIQYVIDIQQIIDQSQGLLIDGNEKASQLIIEKVLTYYYVLGSILMLFLFIINGYLIKASGVEINQYKYLILMIPENKLDNSVIKQKLINIRTYFF